MTAPQTTATNDPQSMAALQQMLDAALLEKASLTEELAARDAALALRNSEFGEQIEQQSATIDVLKVMSASPDDPQPVFDLIARQAAKLCNVPTAAVAMSEFDGEYLHLRAWGGWGAETSEDYLRQFPMRPDPGTAVGRAILNRRVIHIRDVDQDSGIAEAVRTMGVRSTVAIPLLRGEQAIGVIAVASPITGGFADPQVELLGVFAEQAVIAISTAETYRNLHEALEQQTATAEVLEVINISPGDLTPVFDAMLEKAMRLCGAAFGSLYTYDGERFHSAAHRGVPPAFAAYRAANPPLTAPGSGTATVLATRRSLHVLDLKEHENYRDSLPGVRAMLELGGVRTVLGVPLVKDDIFLGYISVFRQEVRAFSDKQIALLENFAAQAVIAMENARLLTEQREALEQQTATAEVLQVINASPGDLKPVFDAMLEKALRLCDAAFGTLLTFDGDQFHTAAQRGLPARYVEYLAATPAKPGPGGGQQRVLRGERFVQFIDMKDDEAYRSDANPVHRAMVDLGGARTGLIVPLRKDDALVGTFTIYRQEVRAFSDKQIVLLENFAAQAVIAMENARLLDEIRQRQEELRITFENMGDGVAMFDETQHLVAWNRKFQEVFDLPDDLLAQHRTYDEHLRFLAARGDFGASVDTAEQIRGLVASTGQPYGYERTRPDGRVIEIRRNPVPDGGFVLIFSDITERKRSEVEIRAARDSAEAALRELKAAQANLIQAEKMASLGQLTAGIAHEIKNPLNFVNNFAELSVDLLGELKDAIVPVEAALNPDQRDEVYEVVTTLTSNLEKITEHGKRADGIVKAMLEHSRGSSAERRIVDLNVVIDEALNLAYHGARAQDQSFNITLERDFGEGIAPIEVNPQDMTRVFLNIFSNGFYAATRRARNGGDTGFEPTLKVTTRDAGEVVEIRVRDNGTGVTADIRDKLFQPFFTTKPTGEGTGLGLSITYDIVTKQHGGTITVDSEVDEFTEFVVTLPRRMFTDGGNRA